MITVSPSILSCDFLQLKNEVGVFNKASDIWIHLDIMDNHFVPNLTFGNTVIKNLHQVTKHPLDAHFMVTDPESFIIPFSKSKIHNFTFHLEALPSEEAALPLIKKIRKFYPSVGISIRPKTPFESVSKNILSKIDLLLVMTVEPGFGGQSFIEDSWKKLTEIKTAKAKSKFSFITQVDGGVCSENINKLYQHGVENVVAGSFIFATPNRKYLQTIKQLRKQIQE